MTTATATATAKEAAATTTAVAVAVAAMPATTNDGNQPENTVLSPTHTHTLTPIVFWCNPFSRQVLGLSADCRCSFALLNKTALNPLTTLTTPLLPTF